MHVNLSPEQEAQLSRIASRNGKDAEQLVKQAVGRLLDDQERLAEAVKQAILAARNAGELPAYDGNDDEAVNRIKRLVRTDPAAVQRFTRAVCDAVASLRGVAPSCIAIYRVKRGGRVEILHIFDREQ